MDVTDEVMLSKTVSQCRNGITLVWATTSNTDFAYVNVPKYPTKQFPGEGVWSVFGNYSSDRLIKKYVRVFNDKVNGDSLNIIGTRVGFALVRILSY
ncbi:hypothetical protein ACFVR2_22975 [Gottfriedia sp. NPDC057991]|uniref:hypothetical protein n=1 Tax=Gottfriedia sp. NPDC057991 TaxID=3346298 RepID=UPI0036D835BD